ncbi:hypothetical protein Tco_0937144 [Tanacetum coccineum]|uniref:Uncharacterized protein n=1 Tax=Tanacetum coccineum TaxID=301880 RepID=A0ABQ5DE59_9ASTR
MHLSCLNKVAVLPKFRQQFLNLEVMDAPTIPVSADSSKGNFKDDIDIGLDVCPTSSVAADGCPSGELSTLRFRMGIAEAENASLRSKIRTMEAIETVTRSQERRTRRKDHAMLRVVTLKHLVKK